MGKKCKTHSPKFKAKVALAAIQNDETTSQIASRFGVYPTMASTWKQADAKTEELYRQIGHGLRHFPRSDR